MLFLLLGGTSKVSAQEMRALFMTAPDNVLPMLSGIMRADLVDYVDAGMKGKVTNLLDGLKLRTVVSTSMTPGGIGLRTMFYSLPLR